jgi:hypothetical protein
MKIIRQQRSTGFIALFTVIALAAFSLSLIVAVAYLSINESQEGLMLARGEDALQLTEGCAEDALLLSVRDEGYRGGSYGYMGGDCTVVVSKDGTTWTLDVSGTKERFTRSVRIIFDYTIGPPGSIALQSWLER